MFSMPMRWMVTKEWWNNLLGLKDRSNSSQDLIQTRSVDQLPKVPLLIEESLAYQSNLPKPKETRLYWISFISPANEFQGVVICRGTSPAAAANWAITTGIVESERANIVMIPLEKEMNYIPFINKLLTEAEVREHFTGLVEKYSNNA